MNTKKICIYGCMLCILGLFLVGCREKPVELAGDVFLTWSETAKGEGVETYEMYTLHADISQSGQVRIYADNFNRWVSGEACPEKTVQLGTDVIQELQTRIDAADLYHMRRNIGNRDLKDGEYKELTLYTTEGEHVSGGLNPSNRDFASVYDYVEEQLRETLYLYRTELAQMQKQGIAAEKNKNLYIADIQDNTLVQKEDINDVYVTCGTGHTRLDMTATPDAEPERNYYVTLLLADAGADVMQTETSGKLVEDPAYYKLYQNNTYQFTFAVTEPVTGGELYIYETTDAEEAVEMAQKLRDSLY